MKNKNTFTLRLSEQQLEKLKAMAKLEKRTVSAIIRNLVDEKEIDTKKVKGNFWIIIQRLEFLLGE